MKTLLRWVSLCKTTMLHGRLRGLPVCYVQVWGRYDEEHISHSDMAVSTVQTALDRVETIPAWSLWTLRLNKTVFLACNAR